MNRVTVVDYGLGNLLSVRRSLEKVGAEVEFGETPEQISKAQRLLLPGVGAFADGMKGLEEKGLVSSIHEFAKSGRPLLGICLGMQMLLDEAEEFGVHRGLGLIPGRVVAIPKTDADGRSHKIPHIGWTDLEMPAGRDSWDGTLLGNISAKSAAYFVHSYTAFPTSEEHRLADSFYGGRRLAAVLKIDNVSGCQFHPEKSGEVGLAILKAFVES